MAEATLLFPQPADTGAGVRLLRVVGLLLPAGLPDIFGTTMMLPHLKG